MLKKSFCNAGGKTGKGANRGKRHEAKKGVRSEENYGKAFHLR